MHCQAAHIALPLRALKDDPLTPLGQALAAVSWTLVLLLQSMCLAEPHASHAAEVTEALAQAREQLHAAQQSLDRLDEQTIALADTLAAVIAAAERSMHAQDN